MTELSQEIKRLVIKRLEAVPANISFSLGNFGSFTKDELIDEIQKNSDVGKTMIEMELTFIREMPKLAKKMSAES